MTDDRYAPRITGDGADPEALPSRFPVWTPGAPLASFVDYSLLRTDTTAAGIERLCEEARAHGCYGVCVGGGWIRLARERLGGTEIKVCAVVGFPLGHAATRAKAFEASAAVDDGASEIDMVLAAGRLIDGEREAVERDIAAVVQAVQGGALVKVLLETALLTDEMKALGCRLAEAAGADFVQTATGYGPAGARPEDIRLMRAAVSPRMGIKASGGIRSRADAEALLSAGANRIGTSSGSAFIG